MVQGQDKAPISTKGLGSLIQILWQKFVYKYYPE